nr:MAG TPA: hypothetical protein [Caudoviricetes sp.]
MEKAKTIKFWPSAHVEVRLHVTEKMIKDLEVCKKAGISPIPSCAECSWEDVHIEEIGACALLTNEMLKQLEGGEL